MSTSTETKKPLPHRGLEWKKEGARYYYRDLEDPDDPWHVAELHQVPQAVTAHFSN